MPLFKLSDIRSSKDQDKKAVSKSRRSSNAGVIVKGKKGNDLLTRINEIRGVVEKNLGQYADEYQVIMDQTILHDFISEAIHNGYIAIDTETEGLDPLQNRIAGICPFTPGQKSAYIPLNHMSCITNAPTPSQLDIDFVAGEFKRLFNSHPEVDMFNATFDVRVLRNQAKIDNAYCTWDGFIASKLLNENELEANLKTLHNKYCLGGHGDAFRFDDLFKGIPFTYIPIQTAYLYAGHDPIITYELCEYQRKYLRPDSDREDMRAIYWVFKNIEMPCVQVVTQMEDTGVLVDLEYQKELSVKYHKLLDDNLREVYDEIGKYQDQIDKYKRSHPDSKLDDPINLNSPPQIAVLLYDILGIKPVDKKKPRGTGEEILTKIDNPICKSLLKYRGNQKLISTYIDKLPDCINPKDGRIHCKFNQYGAKTGRFSSEDPNLQNIPSHNKDIRKMFIASNMVTEIPEHNNSFIVDRWSEVQTPSGWRYADTIVAGDELIIIEDNTQSSIIVSNINILVDKNQIIYYY